MRMDTEAILKMVNDSFFCHIFDISFMVYEHYVTMQGVLNHLYIITRGKALKASKVKL